jgi:FKBP-type peptidyl-prolyl cis-trans isomerase FkpA
VRATVSLALAAWVAAVPPAAGARTGDPPTPPPDPPAVAEPASPDATVDPSGESAAAPQAQPAPETPPVPPVQVTEAGPQLLMEDLRPGAGTEAAPGMSLAVHYTGWLHEPTALGYRGRQFDSSRDRGSPFAFTLGAGRVIRGWDIGLIGLKVGGLRRLVIPPELAYGNRDVGNGLIPPNSTLVFEVELLGVESNILVEGAK